MKIREYFRTLSPAGKLIILLLLVLAGAIVVSVPMLFAKGTSALLLAVYLQNIGMFILPAWIAAYLFWGEPGKSLYLSKPPRIAELLSVVALFIVAIPALNWVVEWNESMSLPSALRGVEQWMREQESLAEAVTEQLLQINSWTGILAVILGVGVLTGMGEEMIFRGVIQPVFQGGSRRAHLAVWACAFLFSAIHLQFFGFIPRMLLGAFFGYLLVWSRNLWLPIFAHVFNNSMVVCSSHWGDESGLMESVGTSASSTQWVAAVSLLATLALIYWLRKNVFQPKA